MATARRIEDWDRTASLIATTRAVHGDKQAHPHQFNPYRNRDLPKIGARELGQLLKGDQ